MAVVWKHNKLVSDCIQWNDVLLLGIVMFSVQLSATDAHEVSRSVWKMTVLLGSIAEVSSRKVQNLRKEHSELCVIIQC